MTQTNGCFKRVWKWLKEQTKNDQWESVFTILLIAGADKRGALPNEALYLGWQLWEIGDHRFVDVLLKADRRDAAVEMLFQWARSNSDETKTVRQILGALIQVSPTKEVTDFSADWIKSRTGHSLESLAVLRPLLKEAPDDTLLKIAQELLKKTTDPRLYWSILELIIQTTKEPSAITRAEELLSMETSLSFRQNLAYSYGTLLLALLDCDKPTTRLKTCAREWIELHAHRFPDVAESVEAGLERS